MKASVPGSLDPPFPGIEEWEPPRHTHPLMPSLVEYTVEIPSANGNGDYHALRLCPRARQTLGKAQISVFLQLDEEET